MNTLAILGSFCFALCLSKGHLVHSSTPDLQPTSDSQCIPLPETALKCVERNQVYEKPNVIGQFVAQCNSDGDYETLQCYGSTGYCCCVGPDGKQLEGPGNIRAPGNNGMKLKCST